MGICKDNTMSIYTEKKKPTINSNMGDTKHLTKLLAFIEIEFYKRRIHQGPR